MIELIISSIAIITVTNVLIINPTKHIHIYRLNILMDNYKNGYGISFKEAYPY